jgi:crotonobetainyl-CoA:carnitine CoA-transferase CaiB-like acyl-CoA transferase
MTPILDGIRIVDCTIGLAGPEATRLLAEAGAEVVKVEPPTGDVTRGTAGFSTWNRSKRSVVLDLSRPADREQLHRLLSAADVFVHGFRPSQARALGVDDASLRSKHPHLITTAITGYPGEHTDAERSGWDILVQARSGAMWEMDGHRPGPIYLRLPVASWSTCYLATAGILARLLVRQKTGRTGPAHTSLHQGMLAVLAMLWHRAELATPEMQAKLPLPKGFPAPALSMFQCADDAWIQVLPGYLEHPLVIETVAELGGYIDVAEAYPIPSPDQLSVLRAAFRRHASHEWLDALQRAGYPAEPVVELGSVFSDPEALENGYVVELDDPERGPVREAAWPFTMDPSPEVSRAAPALGECDPRRLDWTPRAASVGAPTPLSSPLSGIRVLDLGMFLAAPLASMLFADMGADVIKVEPPGGDRMRVPSQMTLFLGCQRGKRSVVLDLRDPAARPALHRLVQWADVVHHNLRNAAARALGVDYETLREINPRLVYCHVSAYGERGTKADWPGYDPIGQALSGWPVASAPPGQKPLWYRFGMMDHTAAMASMIPTLLALYRREHTGKGDFVSSSLLAVAAATNGETYLSLKSGQTASVPGIDAAQTGLSQFYRIFPTADAQWVAVAAVGQAAQSRLLAAFSCEPADLETAFAARPAGEVLVHLAANEVPCELVGEDLEQSFFDSDAHREAGLIASYKHADYGQLEQPGSFWDFGDLRTRLDRPPPALGEHTVEVLTDLGFSAAEMEHMTGSERRD